MMDEHKLNSSMVVFLPIISLAAIAISVVIILSIGSSYKLLFTNASSTEVADIEANCKKNADRLMLTAQDKDGLLHIIADQGKGLTPQQSFSNISTLLLSCEGYVLENFCAGGGCPGSDKISADFKKATD